MTQFLIKNIHDLQKIKNYQFIDSSYYLPNEQKISFNATPKIMQNDIFFDVDVVADTDSIYNHMFPPKNIFLNYCLENQITYDKHYIFYDHKGIFSAPRVYMTFLAYGFDKISVFDGGYPAFEKLLLSASSEVMPQKFDNTKNLLSLDSLKNPIDLFTHSDFVKQAQQNKSSKIIDARPFGRFNGTVPEPRTGLHSGHIADSINLPFTELLTDDKKFKSVAEMTTIFTNLGIASDDKLIFSCGSGITACVVAMAGLMCGLKLNNIKIYDASWCEWGNGHFDVVTGA